MNYLIGTIVALVVALYYNITKRKDLEAVTKSLNLNKDLSKYLDNASSNAALDQAEADKRKQIETQTKEQLNAPQSNNDLLNFLNSDKS